ncbi:MAG: TRAP transporter small permease [Flavobacteriaceae bacterium]
MRKKIDFVVERILMILMTVMVVNVLWQIFSRYLLNNPNVFTDELARYLMMWLGLLGAAYVAGKNLHVAITYLPSKLNIKAQKKMTIVVTLSILFFSVFVFIVGGGRLVYISYILGQRSPALQIPLAYIYAVLPLTGFLILIYKLDDLKCILWKK